MLSILRTSRYPILSPQLLASQSHHVGPQANPLEAFGQALPHTQAPPRYRTVPRCSGQCRLRARRHREPAQLVVPPSRLHHHRGRHASHERDFRIFVAKWLLSLHIEGVRRFKRGGWIDHHIVLAGILCWTIAVCALERDVRSTMGLLHHFHALQYLQLPVRLGTELWIAACRSLHHGNAGVGAVVECAWCAG